MSNRSAYARCTQQRCPPAVRGFSLLEILVAFAIMAMALGLLYRVMGNNARQTGSVVAQERAMLLAESVLAGYAVVPPDGVQTTGESAGYTWQVHSAPYPTPANAHPGAVRLHQVQISVHWDDGGRLRQFDLDSLRPERLPQSAAGLRP